MISKKSLAKIVRRAAKIELARRSLWYFCKAISPDFYLENRTHLKKICTVLQALYEGRICKDKPEDEWAIRDIPSGIICKKVMLNIPPQHGKTRTLVNFSGWAFGKNIKEKIITGSYNDWTASDFSRYTRDLIQKERLDEDDFDTVIYSDIFPKTQIKRGNSGFEKWALEGAHFSYMGVGVGGSVTSKGGSLLIVDDPVKNAEEALNENNLERIWLWYTSTFLSRVSADKGEPLEIICMTRWSHQDVCGRLLNDPATYPDWYVLKMSAYEQSTDSMLCESLFGKKRLEDIKRVMYPAIFNANYLQETIEEAGTLFFRKQLKRFSLKDYKKDGKQSTLGYADIADEGDDYFCMPMADVFKGKVFITDVIYTQENLDVTLPLSSAMIIKHNADRVWIEANNQGSPFVKMLRSHPAYKVPIHKVVAITNTVNKHTRIVMQSAFVMEYCYFLEESEIVPGSDYDKFVTNVCGYMKDGSSKKDDGPDALSGLAGYIQSFVPHLFR